MYNDKVVGFDNIPVKIWNYTEEKGTIWLIKLFNKILRSKNEVFASKFCL